MKRAIRLNDPTSHGGAVAKVGATQTRVMGQPLAPNLDAGATQRQIPQCA